jgi:hypothetical protein
LQLQDEHISEVGLSQDSQDEEDANGKFMLKLMAKISKSKNPAKKSLLEAKLSKVLEAVRIQAIAKAEATANVKKAKAQHVLQFNPKITSSVLGAGQGAVGTLPMTAKEKERRQQRQLRFQSTTFQGEDRDEVGEHRYPSQGEEGRGG